MMVVMLFQPSWGVTLRALITRKLGQSKQDICMARHERNGREGNAGVDGGTGTRGYHKV